MAAAMALALVAPWLVRGGLVYGWGDPLGLGRHHAVVVGQALTGTPGAAEIARMGATLFRSFWGQFGWMGVLLDERIYLALALLTGVLLVGVVAWLAPWGGFWRDMRPIERRMIGLAALTVAAVTAGTVVYNLMYLQPQGRYLFPAMGGIALLAALGARELIAPRQRAAVFALGGAALVLLDLVALFRFIEPDLRG